MTAASVSPNVWSRLDAPVTEPTWRLVIRIWIHWFAFFTVYFALVQRFIGSDRWSTQVVLLLAMTIAMIGSGGLSIHQWRAARRLRLGGVSRVWQGAVLEVSDEDLGVAIERLQRFAGRYLEPNRDGELVAWAVPSAGLFRIRVRRAAPGILRIEGRPRIPTASVDGGQVLKEVLHLVTWYEASRGDPAHELESR